MNNYRVFVIIVTYNGMAWIEKCLLSIRESEFPLSTIIIDNGSQDGTQACIKDSFPEVEFVQSEKNIGFGAANNKGVSIAIKHGATHVFLLNQDTHIYTNTIGELLKIYFANNNLAVLSPIHLNDAGDKLDSNFQLYISPEYCPNFISDSVLNRLKPYYSISFVNAAAWLVDVEVIKKIGLFSDAFFHYAEDSNFLQRLSYFKYKCAIVPNVFIHHYRQERKGKMPPAHQRRKHDINMLRLLLNINNTYIQAYKRILVYAAKRLLHGEMIAFSKLIILPLIKYKYYTNTRKSYMQPKGLS